MIFQIMDDKKECFWLYCGSRQKTSPLYPLNNDVLSVISSFLKPRICDQKELREDNERTLSILDTRYPFVP